MLPTYCLRSRERARLNSQARTLAVTRGANTQAMTCMTAGLAGHSRSLPCWCGVSEQLAQPVGTHASGAQDRPKGS